MSQYNLNNNKSSQHPEVLIESSDEDEQNDQTTLKLVGENDTDGANENLSVGGRYCRHEFNTIFFGRRDSNRYRMADNRGIGTVDYDPYKSMQQENEEKIAKQLRLQLVIGGIMVVVFVSSIAVVISMSMAREEVKEYIRMEPRNSQGGSVIRLDRHNDDDLAALLARINGELDEYEIRRWYPRLRKAGRRAKDCRTAFPKPGLDVCVPQLEIFSTCNTYNAFGYVVGDPCVLLKAGPALTKNYSTDLWLDCRATIDSSGAEIPLRFYPQITYQNRTYAYFPRYFFPYKPESSFYLSPLAMLQLLNPPSDQSFRINCSLANEEFKNLTTLASLQLLFL